MNKKNLSIFGTTLLLASMVSSVWGYEGKEIEQLSEKMATKIAAKGKNTVAVVDFTDLEGNVTQLDQFIAEEFSVALAGASKGFRVIDRTRLKSIIKENKLGETGFIDPATASKLGKIAGVDALVTGTLTPFGDNVRLTVKVLDSETADIIDSAKSNFAKTQAINELLGKEVEQESPASGRTAINTKKVDKGDMTKEVNGFLFDLKECKTSVDAVNCSLSIKSTVKDNELKLCAKCYRYSTVIYDDAGNEYWSSRVSLGEYFDKGMVERKLIAGIQTKASFEFKEISRDAKMIALFEIKCTAENEEFAVQFRNIPISK